MHCSTTLLLFWKHRSDRHLSITLSLIVEITIYQQQKPLLLHTWPRNTTNSQPDQRICIPGEIRVEHTHLGCCSVIRFSVNWNMSLKNCGTISTMVLCFLAVKCFAWRVLFIWSCGSYEKHKQWNYKLTINQSFISNLLLLMFIYIAL